jgi:hypothetical protein
MADNNNEQFSNRVLGWAFALIAVALILIMTYVIVGIVRPLTSETTIATSVIRAYSQDFEKQSSSKTIDEDTVRFLIGLEYSAAAIRTVSVQIAVASVGGVFLIVVGILLFASGSIRPMSAEATASQRTVRLQEAAPGTVTAILGAIILGLGVTKEMTHGEISFSHKTPGTAAVTQATDFNATSSISNDPLPEDERYQQGAKLKGEANKL